MKGRKKVQQNGKAETDRGFLLFYNKMSHYLLA